jgi:hypothetical protein
MLSLNDYLFGNKLISQEQKIGMSCAKVSLRVGEGTELNVYSAHELLLRPQVVPYDVFTV